LYFNVTHIANLSSGGAVRGSRRDRQISLRNAISGEVTFISNGNYAVKARKKDNLMTLHDAFGSCKVVRRIITMT
jgi:hypothetical protein